MERYRRAAVWFLVGAVLLALGTYLRNNAGDSGLGTIPLPASSGNLPEPIAGVPCVSGLHETATYFAYPHLDVYVDGQPVEVPAGVGVVVDSAGEEVCMYLLHTHDAKGTLHVEAPEPGTFTLGQFFDVAGVPLSLTNVAGFEVQDGQQVRAFLDGTEMTPLTAEALWGIELLDGRQIVIEIGPPWVTAP